MRKLSVLCRFLPFGLSWLYIKPLQSFALSYSAISKSRQTEKLGTDTCLLAPWLTISWHAPIRCHLHLRSYTKSVRQCVCLLIYCLRNWCASGQEQKSLCESLFVGCNQAKEFYIYIYIYFLSCASRVHKNDQHLILNELNNIVTLLQVTPS